MIAARANWVVPAAAGLVYAALGLVWLRFVYLSDFFQMIWLADAQRAGVATAWANGFLGFGYPALLNLITALTGDVLTSGKLMQIAAAVAVLAVMPWTVRVAFGDDRGVRLAQALVAVDPIFLFAAAGETPDMLATALMLPGFACGVRAAATGHRRDAALAGLWLGAAYLVRYHALLLAILVAVLLVVVLRRLALAAVVAGTFLAVAAPQLIASAWVQGNPLFNLHVKSIAIGYYGTTSDFVEHTRPWTLWTIVSTAPVAVAKQYAIHVAEHFNRVGGLLVLLAGVMLGRHGEGRGLARLGAPMAGLILLLAAKFYTDRAVLLPLVVAYLLLARALAWTWAAPRVRTSLICAGLAVAALVSVSILEDGRRASRFRRLATVNDAITRTLRDRGLQDSRRVFTTHLSYYLADDPAGGAFHPHDTWLLYDPNYAAAYPHSYFSDITTLDAFVEREGIGFLLLGPLTGEIAPAVFEQQQTGDLGPGYRLIGEWPDLYLYERVSGSRISE